MIGLIKGSVELIRPAYVLVDTGGVGYKILVTQNILSKLKNGDKVKFFTYTYVREDILELFGFDTPDDLSLFELLLTVSGVGPKTALGIFSKGTTKQIQNAVLTSDVLFFSGVPRLGTKNAQKIIIDLKSKLGSSNEILDFQTQDEEKEITSALVDFGFKTQEVQEALKKIRGRGNSIEERMKLALKNLAK